MRVNRSKIFDITLVTVLAVPAVLGAVLTTVYASRPEVLTSAVFFVGAVLPLLVRRTRPVLVAILTSTIEVIPTAFRMSGSMPFVAGIALYSLGRYTPGRIAWRVGAAVAVVYAGVAVSFNLPMATTWLSLLPPIIGGLAGPMLCVGAGQYIRIRGELKERDAKARADAAVQNERRRIARELHDVVAHHLTVINALVGGARSVMPRDQDAAREALTAAEQTSREALTEMRHLLDVLRAGSGDGPDAATGVGTGGLPALVEQVRKAGLPVTFSVDGDAVPLPTHVDHAVYRIVQEALTNTRKHAAGARATVRLAYLGDGVEVEVLDDGMGTVGGNGAGFGLGGMAERVALCGGRLETGPRPSKGFRVFAKLPL
ncbi:MAG: sensor histidine kinase [Thermoactinospora sp.]|nr:sensor histidine kinase [Thermoactinospora sp.]